LDQAADTRVADALPHLHGFHRVITSGTARSGRTAR
jgi:hypothetical protein